MMHGGIAELLLAAVGGYWVLERASGQKGNLRKLGRLLGMGIIVLSFLSLICQMWCFGGGRMGKGGMCPWSSPRMMEPPVTR